MKYYHVILFLLVSLFFSCTGVAVIETDAHILDGTLELVNETGEDIRILTSIDFNFREGGRLMSLFMGYSQYEPIIFSIPKGSKKVLTGDFGFYPYPIQENIFIRIFDEISFYNPGEEEPFRTYGYSHSRYKGVLEDGWAKDPDDTQFFYGDRSYGTTEQLFIPSNDRPFYLERDSDDPEIGRVVITKVPDPS